ncbi:MAG: DIP1984 family protein [Chthoniobacterales bacterium]
MKLAEAIIIVEDLKKKLESLRKRIGDNVITREGIRPNEDPAELIKQSFKLLQELCGLTVKINIVNARCTFTNGRKLAEIIAQRDELSQQHDLLMQATAQAAQKPEPSGMSGTKWVTPLDVRKLQEQADAIEKKVRGLNLLIQSTNWKIELE